MMPFDWKNFLSLAEVLAANNDDASKRTAISRAYYCVYNLAFARAETTVRPKPRGERYHQWCWNQYKRTVDPTCQQLGNTGERMKRLRVKADYLATDNPQLNDEAKRMLEDARQFLADLAALDPIYPRP